MRPLWKGAISFGLVNIPVGLYSATQSQRKIDFDMLRDSDHSKIRYKRVAEADGAEVPWEHIVKGYEYEKGKHVVVEPEDFERVQIKSNQTVDIKEFVNASDIEPRFYEEPYFLAPEKAGIKAYALLYQALKQSGKVGIAKVVIRPPREHLAAVRPLDGLLALEMMHFAEELRDPGELKVDIPEVGQKEMTMAAALVESMSGEWQPEKYRDEYREALMEVIDQKINAKGKKLPAAKKESARQAGRVVDLVEMLQESIAKAGKKTKSGGRRKAA